MLLTKEYIKENGLYQKNTVDSNFPSLEPHVRTAERLHIRPVLGEALYKELVFQYERLRFVGEGGGIPLAPEMEALLAVVQPALLQWFQYESLPFAATKLATIGAVSRNGQDSEASTLETLKWMQENLRKVAAPLTQDLVDFLQANKANYPLYPQAHEGPADQSPSGRTRFLGGILF